MIFRQRGRIAKMPPWLLKHLAEKQNAPALNCCRTKQLAKVDGLLRDRLKQTDGSLCLQLAEMTPLQRRHLAEVDSSLLEQLAEADDKLLDEVGQRLRGYRDTLRGWIASHETVARLVWHVALCGALWFVFWMGWFLIFSCVLCRDIFRLRRRSASW